MGKYQLFHDGQKALDCDTFAEISATAARLRHIGEGNLSWQGPSLGSRKREKSWLFQGGKNGLLQVHVIYEHPATGQLQTQEHKTPCHVDRRDWLKKVDLPGERFEIRTREDGYDYALHIKVKALQRLVRG